MGKLTKEDVILLFLEDPKKLVGEIWNKNVPKSDEIRTLICDLGDPRCAYLYAINIDKSPHLDTRQAAYKDPGYAYFYTLDVDKSPRLDTRQAACKDPYWKERYEEWEKECSLKKT